MKGNATKPNATNVVLCFFLECYEKNEVANIRIFWYSSFRAYRILTSTALALLHKPV